MFGLPFLNPNKVKDCFTENLVSILPKDKNVKKFIDYILIYK